MNAFDTHVTEVVQMIWSTLLTEPVVAGDADAPMGDPTVTGVVNVDGAWHGAILVRCPLALASSVAAAMYQGDDDPTFAEIGDALGELTNMVAGNVKALLPQPSSISLPNVAFGSSYQINVVGTRLVARVAFTYQSHPLVVSVVQRTADIEPARS